MASNNFFLNNDPLLYQNAFNRNSEAEDVLKRQLNESMLQYKLLQQQTQNNQQLQVSDYLGDLDKLIKKVDNSTLELLKEDAEYQKLNGDLTALIQNEIMSSIKWKLNANTSVVKNVERQTEIINSMMKSVEDEKTKNLNELNDYVKNYSDITFDEYKKIKNKENSKKTTK